MTVRPKIHTFFFRKISRGCQLTERQFALEQIENIFSIISSWNMRIVVFFLIREVFSKTCYTQMRDFSGHPLTSRCIAKDQLTNNYIHDGILKYGNHEFMIASSDDQSEDTSVLKEVEECTVVFTTPSGLCLRILWFYLARFHASMRQEYLHKRFFV